MDRDTLKSALASTPDCLPVEKLGELSVEQARTHLHVSQCTRCQTELALLRQFESDQPLPGEGAAVAWISSQLERRLDQIKSPATMAKHPKSDLATGRATWLSRLFSVPGFRFAAPIAAAAVVAVAALLLFRSPKEPELHANLGSGSTIYRSQEVQVVAPMGDLQKVPGKLEWKAVQGAAAYKILVTEVDRTEVWNTQTTDTFVTIPNSVAVKIRVRKPFYWKVTALDPNGAVLASSQAQRFVVTPEATR